MSRVSLIILTSAALAAPSACKNGDRAAPQAAATPRPVGWQPERVAELFFTTEVDGYVEPCGCTTEPLGGIQRMAQVVEKSEVPHGLVDAGNLFFPVVGLTDVTRPQHVLKSHVLARAFRQMGALAINVAEADLAEGALHLRMLQQEGAVPLVSANVRPMTGGPEIARSFVRTLGGIKIGITGVATPEQVAAASKEVTVIEYVPSLSSEVKVLREAGAEVVVVLAHVGEAGASELARLVPGVDIIVRAPGTPIEREPAAPRMQDGVLIVEAGSQGQRLGRIRFAFGAEAPPRPLVMDDAGAQARQRRTMAAKRADALKVQIAAMEQDPAKADAVKALRAQIARLTASTPEVAEAPLAKPHVRVDLIPLTVDVPGSEPMKELLVGYYQELQKMNLSRGDVAKCATKDKDTPRFVGTAKCVECHEEAYAFWKETKHAKAWATLQKDGKHYDLTCVGCHMVGYERPGGVCRLQDVGGFEDVGCENCHGPGSIHVEDEDSTSIQLTTTAETCKSYCHVPEHSDGFEYETYLKKITGPGHELSGG
ncbi:MAG: hypothetical protein H6730_32165 [Deltaproteobacteria bacterium]|nr:hypothetical protein [Deltaproteobacteria bacterium]